MKNADSWMKINKVTVKSTNTDMLLSNKTLKFVTLDFIIRI